MRAIAELAIPIVILIGYLAFMAFSYTAGFCVRKGWDHAARKDRTD